MISFSWSTKFLNDEFCVLPVNDQLEYYGVFKGTYSSNEPIEFRQSGGRSKYDLMNAGFSLILISENLVSLLKDNKITGWGTYPVRIFDKKGHEVRGYHGLSVTGRCDRIRYDDFGIIERRNDNNDAYQVRKGLLFDISSWDGSDIFSPDESMFIFVSERVEAALKNCSNVRFENTSDVEGLIY